MIAATTDLQPPRVLLSDSNWDALLIGLAFAHGAAVIAVPTLPVIALGLWWNSNTIAHYFIHRPFFRSCPLNLLFSLYQSILLGVPQSIWRDRHLAHHAGLSCRIHFSFQMGAEVFLIVVLWSFLVICFPAFFFKAYLPGYFAGLVLCWLHGYYEHSRGTTSHYGSLYNLLFFNDGYHVEHHLHPSRHWAALHKEPVVGADASRYPAILRWLEMFSLETLERFVLHSKLLQWFVLRCHEKAFRILLPHFRGVRRVCIIGGGLFPRSLLILRRLLPEARFIVIDKSAENIRKAQYFGEAEFIHGSYDPAREARLDFDLVIIPLSLAGDRDAIYRNPPAPLVVVHDWIWHSQGTGAILSLFLLKRLNLIQGKYESGVRMPMAQQGQALLAVKSS